MWKSARSRAIQESNTMKKVYGGLLISGLALYYGWLFSWAQQALANYRVF